MQDDWKAYFTFTRRERTGFISLLVVIGALSIWPHFFPDNPEKISVYQLGENSDSTIEAHEASKGYLKPEDSKPGESFVEERESGRHYFYFDPNTLSDSGWAKLGIRERTIGTIRKYINKGGKFRKPEDLGRIYGISNRQLQFILPFVRIKSSYQSPSANALRERKYSGLYQRKGKEFDKSYSGKIMEINTADSLDWVKLPGIGPKLSSRILNFRSKLGGFYSVGQIAETYGLADSVFQKIKSRMSCDASNIHLLHLNTVTEAELRQHPYIDWKLAKVIVTYRAQHGNYKNINDLRQIVLINDSIFIRLKPYVSVE